MAHAPFLKVYDAQNRYRAALVHPEDAACLVAFLGDGATIRYGHTKRHVVWTEGAEGQSAGDSYDHTAEVVNQRIDGLATREADRVIAEIANQIERRNMARRVQED